MAFEQNGSNWDRDVVDLGNVKENNKVKAEFTYLGENIIRDFTFSCDCINHELKQNVYAFYFDTKQLPKNQNQISGSKLIIVHYKDGNKDILTIKYNLVNE